MLADQDFAGLENLLHRLPFDVGEMQLPPVWQFSGGSIRTTPPR
jgi:hypothetical protein